MSISGPGTARLIGKMLRNISVCWGGDVQGVLEISYELDETVESVRKKANQAFSDYLRQVENLQQPDRA